MYYTTPQTPCFNCTDRYPGCHSKCSDWDRHQEQKQKREALRPNEHDIINYEKDRGEYMQRKYGRK